MKNVLLIEDDMLISNLVKFRLKKDGYEVTIVEDGQAGIEAIDTLSPDLIITDVMMPFRNGLEIINHAKMVNPKVPVIVLSSLGEEENTVLEAFTIGASDFIPKPFKPNELSFRVKKWLKYAS
ncbi:response regulator transcription factor [Belliella kenyensis]|uniref:Response regulator transcription factor n=1 Tax=Belliella kenyensis TaxID=1472724 RepID=A0ABV8EGR3_9BACT|nr:response regulator [Belliella kenyensis]MCH7401194.1 response regulator [Belliella kenyensis]MDN3604191.1 response regulator [Belliella kenyensis]